MKVLARHMKEHVPDLRYAEIKVFYVQDCVCSFDWDFFQQCDYFVFQHCSQNALQNLCGHSKDEMERHTTNSILLNRTSQQTISIPSIYFNPYWPMSTGANELNSYVPADYLGCFPNYSTDKRMLKLLVDNIPEEEIVERLNSDNYYTPEECIYEAKNTYQNLKTREVQNNIDIPVSDWLWENFTRKRVMHSANHPEQCTFLYVLEKILERMGLNMLPKEPQDLSDEMETLQRPLIAKSVCRAFGLPVEEGQDLLSVNGNTFREVNTYVRYYIDLLEKRPEIKEGISKLFTVSQHT